MLTDAYIRCVHTVVAPVFAVVSEGWKINMNLLSGKLFSIESNDKDIKNCEKLSQYKWI